MGAFSNDYIHRSIVQFDTGLKLGNLMNLIYIPLDIFRNMPHNEIGELGTELAERRRNCQIKGVVRAKMITKSREHLYVSKKAKERIAFWENCRK
mgnify:CR=1 FL=1